MKSSRFHRGCNGLWSNWWRNAKAGMRRPESQSSVPGPGPRRPGKNIEAEVSKPTEAEIINAANAHKKTGSNVALALWLGIALDGIPESLIIGASMEGTAVSMALIGGLFLANLPESMSSAVVMKNQGGKSLNIIVMWGSLMVMTAVGAAIGNAFISNVPTRGAGTA